MAFVSLGLRTMRTPNRCPTSRGLRWTDRHRPAPRDPWMRKKAPPGTWKARSTPTSGACSSDLQRKRGTDLQAFASFLVSSARPHPFCAASSRLRRRGEHHLARGREVLGGNDVFIRSDRAWKSPNVTSGARWKWMFVVACDSEI